MKIVTRKRFVSILVSVVVLFMAYGAPAQVPKIVSSSIKVDFSELNTLWFQAIDLLRSGNLLEANLKLTDLNQKKFEIGLDNLPLYSTVLIKEARKLQAQGNLGEAIKLLESARLLSPDFAPVYFASVRFQLAQDFTDVYGIVQDLWRGLILKYTDINTIIMYVNNGLSSVLLTGMLASSIFILFSFVYYRRAIFYQIKEMFPFELPTFIAHIIGWVLLGIVTLGLGVFWGILFLAFLLIWHVEPASKRILQIVLFFGALLAVLLIVIGITFNTFDGDYFQALRDVSRGEYSSRSATALQERLKVNPNDAYAMFGLAYIAQKAGNIQDAIEAYEVIPSQYADRATVQNNLGNLYQHQFQTTKQQTWYQRAEEGCKNAIRYAPKMFEPHYNLAQLLLLGLKSEEADGKLQTARKIDNQRFTLYSEYLGGNVMTIDASFSIIALLKKLYEQDSLHAGTTLSERLWVNWSRFKNPWYFSIASGVLFLISFIFGAKKGAPKRGVLYCQMCGDPYTIKRKKPQEQHTFCTQCTYIFKKKTVVKPEKRAAKIKQIQLRQKFRGFLAKVLSFLFPGAGQIYFGYPTKGVLLSFFFYFAFMFYLLKRYLRILLDTGGRGDFSWITLIFLALLLLGSYLFNVYDILKLSPKNQ